MLYDIHRIAFPINTLLYLCRGSWGVSRREVQDAQIITIVPSERDLINSDYDYYASTSARSSMYCRSVAIIVSDYCWYNFNIFCFLWLKKNIKTFSCIQFMALLILRHTLPFMISVSEDDEQYSFTLFTVTIKSWLEWERKKKENEKR